MSENIQPKPQNEEVDLGQLFKMIGKGFQKIYDFFASIFKGAFELLILLISHFFKNVKWYVLALIIGLIAGYFLEQRSEKLYAANMFIETKFNSARQAYEVITEFNQLARVDQDYEELSKRLNISKDETESLRGFNIQPDPDDSELMEQYVIYKLELDSVAKLESTFKDFKAAQNRYNYTNHKIGVAATNKFVFKKINEGLVSEFLDNEYINSVRKTTLENLDKKEAAIDKQIKKLDSIANIYLEIRINESKKIYPANQGTNISLSGTAQSESMKDETKIISEISELQEKKSEIAIERVENKQQINIISSFPVSGYFIDKWYSNKMILTPIVTLGLTMLLFIFINLNRFVKDQEKNN